MPDQITDRDTTWELMGNGQTWTLAAHASIYTWERPTGIDDNGEGSQINVLGFVVAAEVAVDLNGSTASLRIGDTGQVLSGYAGVEMEYGDCHLVNRGLIQANELGIRDASGTIENFGVIESETGIGVEGGAPTISNAGDIYGEDEGIFCEGAMTLHNLAGGRITSEETGIYGLGNTADIQVSNDGLLRGGEYAIYCEGRLDLTSTGTIIGDILAGGDNDRFDMRDGVLRGRLLGGQGDDLYIISSSRIRIEDAGASYNDAVRSTVSYTLALNLDHLTLLGKKNIDATGNGGANDLTGNSGNNRLSGGDDSDRLEGRAGRDILIGGEAGDHFVFERGFGTDRIVDFIDTVDSLECGFVRSRKQFDRLDIRQAGDDVVIDFGRGDRLILQDFRKDQFGFDDFAVS